MLFVFVVVCGVLFDIVCYLRLLLGDVVRCLLFVVRFLVCFRFGVGCSLFVVCCCLLFVVVCCL